MLSLHEAFNGWFQAGDFLMPDGNHSAAQETELDENVHINNDYADTASLMEQVMCNIICCC